MSNRLGEIRIAREAAALRKEAMYRIQELTAAPINRPNNCCRRSSLPAAPESLVTSRGVGNARG